MNTNEISVYAIPGLQPIDLNTILKKTASAFGVTVEAMRSKTRKRNVVFARHAYCYFSRTRTKETFSTIGSYIVRDHATALFSVRVAKNLIETKHKEFLPYFKQLENALL